MNESVKGLTPLIHSTRNISFIPPNLTYSHIHTFTHSQPWALLKAGNKARAGSVISVMVNLIHLLSQILDPFLPVTAANLRTQLNVPHK